MRSPDKTGLQPLQSSGGLERNAVHLSLMRELIHAQVQQTSMSPALFMKYTTFKNVYHLIIIERKKVGVR